MGHFVLVCLDLDCCVTIVANYCCFVVREVGGGRGGRDECRLQSVQHAGISPQICLLVKLITFIQCRRDMTAAVEWALKSNCLSIYPVVFCVVSGLHYDVLVA